MYRALIANAFLSLFIGFCCFHPYSLFGHTGINLFGFRMTADDLLCVCECGLVSLVFAVLLSQGECVVLRDRKLNIAPAIKKQVNFNQFHFSNRICIFMIDLFFLFFFSIFSMRMMIGRCCDKWRRLLCTNPASSTQQYSDRSIFSCCCSWSISADCSSSIVPANHTIPTILSILQCTNGKSNASHHSIRNVGGKGHSNR